MEIPRPADWGGGGEFHMALGTYERGEIAYVLQRLEAGDVFVDIGAHIGYFTLPVARRVGPAGRVIAVEPSPASAEILNRNVVLNDLHWVDFYQVALSDEDGEAELSVSKDSVMWNSLRPEGILGAISETIPVKTRSLTSLLNEAGTSRVAGLKLDVEGLEIEVLQGAEEVLNLNPHAFLMFECSGGGEGRVESSLRTMAWLEERGYRFRTFEGGRASHLKTSEEITPRLYLKDWQDHLFNLIAER
jgi:FkbM family methyltransferase